MLHSHLQNANIALKSLIEISLQDIDDIKEARHEEIFARLEGKNNLISDFKNHKDLADSAMREMIAKHPNKGIADLLDENAMALIDEMRLNLKELRTLNKNYARSVIAVSEFYGSLINAIIPNQRNYGYGYRANYENANTDFIRCEA